MAGMLTGIHNDGTPYPLGIARTQHASHLINRLATWPVRRGADIDTYSEEDEDENEAVIFATFLVLPHDTIPILFRVSWLWA